VQRIYSFIEEETDKESEPERGEKMDSWRLIPITLTLACPFRFSMGGPSIIHSDVSNAVAEAKPFIMLS